MATGYDELMMPRVTPSQFHNHLTILALLWAAFIVYGSMLPLDFHAVSSEKVSYQFLGLGNSTPQSRSITDWITNIGIFMPIAFFGFGAIFREQNPTRTITGVFAILGSCFFLSLGIEFSQLYFPPRNSSVLDVVAQSAGSIFGILGWVVFGKKVSEFYQTVFLLHLSSTRPLVLSRKSLQNGLLTTSILMILVLSGAFTTKWVGWDAAIAKWDAFRSRLFRHIRKPIFS